MTGNRATAGATLEAIMSKQVADDHSNLVELNDRELDSVTGGTKTIDAASPNLFKGCCTGKHFANATVTVR
jgi:type VI protein secretion system component Hcp